MFANKDLEISAQRAIAGVVDTCSSDWTAKKMTVWRRTCILAATAALVGVSTAVEAQGQSRSAGPDRVGPSVPGAAQPARPLPESAIDGPLMGAEAALDRRAAAERRRVEAEAHRTAAQENSNSEEARANHPPDEHAAPEAFAAEENAANRDSQNERRQENREDHGSDPASDEQD